MSKRRARRPQPTTDKRSPEERLEALVREPNPERGLRMLERIRNDLDAGGDPAVWIAATRTLSERLIISERVLHYLIDVFLESVTLGAASSDAELVALRDEMIAIERAHGLRDDEYWHLDDAPAEWRDLDDAWSRRADAIGAEFLRSRGHADFAALYEADRTKLDELVDGGRIELWGEDEDDDYVD